ncbi:hypothetical protein GGX14DRAFT_423366, partial [Mycena pura]
MFHSSPYYRSPIPNPREKYLAALADARAAEAEYLAAERLQQEEDSLRQRLEQIQRLKQHDAPQPLAFDSYRGYPSLQSHAQYHHPFGYDNGHGHDVELLRSQIAVEERARITREQQARRLRKLEAEHARKQEQARELEALRLAQVAREHERTRALATQQAHLAALMHRAPEPVVRVIVADTAAPAPQRHHHASRPGCTTPFKPKSQPQHKVSGDHGVEDFQDLLKLLFGAHVESRQPKAEASASSGLPNDTKPAPVTLEQLIGGFLSAAGIEVAQQSSPVAASQETSKGAPAASQTSVPSRSAKVPQPAPTPALSSQPTPAPAPAPSQSSPQAVSLEQLFNHFRGPASAPNKVDLPQLLNIFFGNHTHAQPTKAPEVSLITFWRHSSQASSSKSKSTALKEALEARLRSEESNEDQDLAEAIRLSLSDLDAANTTPADSKGKAPAAEPVADLTTSAAEVKAINASYASLADEFVFPERLDFSTSRTSSPARSTTSETSESIISLLSYSAQNQPLRFYHQSLSALLARLDAVESFGDEELRHARKEAVGRVEGALEEVERVVEARWRKLVGKEERKEEPAAIAAAPAEAEAAVEPEEVAVVVSAEDVSVVEAAPAVELEPSVEPAADVETVSAALPEPSSYPPKPTTA